MWFVDPKIVTLLVLGFLLGIEHAFDADHVVAVSTLVTKNRNLKKSSFLGIFWGIGHTTTLFVVGLAILTLKLTIPNRIALSMEFVVGAMLVLLGILVLREVITGRIHMHCHSHGEDSHLHLHAHREEKGHRHEHIMKPEFKSLLVGMVHGLAGSAALILLVLASAPSVTSGLFYILTFGVGSITGMMLISTLISLPFILTARSFQNLNEKVRTGAGLVSIGLGIIIMLETGVWKGLF